MRFRHRLGSLVIGALLSTAAFTPALAQLVCLRPVDHSLVGNVTGIEVTDGKVYVVGDDGTAVYDRPVGRLVQIPPPVPADSPSTAARVVAVELLADRALILRDDGFFKIMSGPEQVPMKLSQWSGGQIRRLNKAGDQIIVDSESGAYSYSPATDSFTLLSPRPIGAIGKTLPAGPGTALLLTDLGLWAYHHEPDRLVRLGDTSAGTFAARTFATRSGAVFSFNEEWFSYDATSDKLALVGGLSASSVQQIFELGNGQVVIRTRPGNVFRFDAAAGRMLPLASRPLQTIRQGVALPDGSSVVLAGGRVYLVTDAAVRQVGTGSPDLQVRSLLPRPDGSVLALGHRSYILVDPAGISHNPPEGLGRITGLIAYHGENLLVGTSTGLYSATVAAMSWTKVSDTPVLPNAPEPDGLIQLEDGKIVLFRGPQDIFLYDPATGRAWPAGLGVTGPIAAVESLSADHVLLGASQGLYRLDPQARTGGPVGSATPVADVTEIDAAGDRWALVRSAQGWLAYGRSASGTGNGLATPVAGPADAAATWTPLADGGLLQAGVATFHFNGPGGRLRPLSASGLQKVDTVLPLPDGGALLTDDANHLFDLVIWPLKSAGLRSASTQLNQLMPGPNKVEITINLKHPCASVADRVGLELVAGPEHGKPETHGPVRIQAAPGTNGGDIAEVAASLVFDHPGTWTLRVTDGIETTDASITIPIDRPLFARLTAMWETLAIVGAAVYAAAFLTLLVLAHYSRTALRLLSDDVWSRFVTWPFFLLRHAGPVQRWVLQPWFRAVQAAVPPDVPYFDLPVRQAQGGMPESAATPASALLRHLRTSGRIWLQGRSGMGKTSIVGAWERAYYAPSERTALAAAARRFGFIVITVPVRHYAQLAVQDGNRPGWVVEAVRQRLEQFGFPVRDPATVEAMLRSGNLALILDGMNEADRADALTGFARAFPMVRMIVTSQGVAPEAWESWTLPPDIKALRNDLLALWLSPGDAADLAAALAGSSLETTLVSGYDLRLLVDLFKAGTLPDALPRDRVGLYRAMLARAADHEGRPIELARLRKLAWSMILAGRRDIRPEDEAQLPAGHLRALSREGIRIVRQSGPGLEFRHDQMRAFLAASYLVDESPNDTVQNSLVVDGGALKLNRREQEELWTFVAALLPDAGLAELWVVAGDAVAERHLLLAALQQEGGRRGLLLQRPVVHASSG